MHRSQTWIVPFLLAEILFVVVVRQAEAAEVHACTVHVKEEECNRQSQCEFILETDECRPKPNFEPLPCGHRIDDVECLASDSARCRWDADVAMCFPPNEFANCRAYVNKKSCGTRERCKWNKHLKECFDANENVTCEYYHQSKTCTSAGCEWHKRELRCTAEGGQVGCGYLWEGDWCEEREDCLWDEESAVCSTRQAADSVERPLACASWYTKRECSGHQCRWEARTEVCLEEGEELDCQNHVYKEVCKKFPECVWQVLPQLCLPEGDVVTCEMMFEWEPCQRHNSCAWDFKRNLCRKVQLALHDEL